jgi:hypothetical protein
VLAHGRRQQNCRFKAGAANVDATPPAVYLAISLPPVVFPVRQVLDAWMPGPIDKYPFLRKAFLVFIITVRSPCCQRLWSERGCMHE